VKIPPPLHASSRVWVSSSRIAGISAGSSAAGCGPSASGRSPPRGAGTQRTAAGNCAVHRGGRRLGVDHPGLEQLHVRPGHDGGVVGVRVRGVLGEKAAELRGGQEKVVAGRLRWLAARRDRSQSRRNPAQVRDRPTVSVIRGLRASGHLPSHRVGVRRAGPGQTRADRAKGLPQACDLRKSSRCLGLTRFDGQGRCVDLSATLRAGSSRPLVPSS
jgi:hypothetical protein